MQYGALLLSLVENPPDGPGAGLGIPQAAAWLDVMAALRESLRRGDLTGTLPWLLKYLT